MTLTLLDLDLGFCKKKYPHMYFSERKTSNIKLVCEITLQNSKPPGYILLYSLFQLSRIIIKSG